MRPFSKIFVYLRFSSDGQADGLSFERQRAAAERHLALLGVERSSPEVVWVEDPGYSAFHGEHIRIGKFGKFVEQVRSGKITGGLLVCEAVSRATRQGSFALLPLIQDFLRADFTVQLLDGTPAFNSGNVPRFLGTMLAMQADIAQAESQIKSDYSLANWAKRRERARTDGKPFTSECPRWLEVKDGVYAPITDRVESVVKVYELVRDGWGVSKIVRHANRNGWAAPGKNAGWHNSLINRLLNNRALIGEFQPYQRVAGKRVALGETIQSYYPVVIDKDLFHAVQNIRNKTSKFPGRRDDNNYNYLLGLAKCECGSSWRRVNKNSGKQVGYAQYTCANRVRQTTDCPSMPARAFDHIFVSIACERIPAMLATDGQNELETERLSIEAQLGDLQSRREALLEFIQANPDLAAEVGDKLRSVVSARQTLEGRLKDIIVSEVPQDFSFGEALGVFLPAFLDIYDPSTPDGEAAFRARALFRSRIVEAVQGVEVARDRKSFSLQLKNGARIVHPMALFDLPDGIEDAGFGPPIDMTDEELRELAESRSEGLSKVKRLRNPVVPRS
ncbi:recombinase family protein [Paraburkholderia nemoris]|uniref:recombinase family protein n=1 Tax=Paraburkholderia nemoris TaxID=2793076 RepID=UPI0038BBFAFA